MPLGKLLPRDREFFSSAYAANKVEPPPNNYNDKFIAVVFKEMIFYPENVVQRAGGVLCRHDSISIGEDDGSWRNE